jgi:hypothetical protein
MTPQLVRLQLAEVFTRMITSGLSMQQFHPSCNLERNGVESIGDLATTAISLKNIAYETIYLELINQNAFHMKLQDGGLLIFQYIFDNQKVLLKHRLAFFPSPRLPTIEEAPDLYANDEMYGDILLEKIVRFPVRFDFDPKNFKDVIHPKSHLTLGQFENCRLPITSPVTPYSFLMFVLRNFYFQSYKKNKNIFDKKIHYISPIPTITNNEKLISHLVML